MIPISIQEIVRKAIKVSEGEVEVVDQSRLQSSLMDRLVWKAVFGDEREKAAARWIIWEIAQQVGVKPASINDFYMVKGRGEVASDFTVPAMNLRGMAYDMGRAVFSKVKRNKVGAFIVELARSEMGYTDQSPSEHVTVMLAAALREGYRGTLFIQGDHFQAKAATPGVPKEGEIKGIEKLIKESVGAGFLNIDIDMSTLVDLGKRKETEQQAPNVEYTAQLLKLIRSLEPKGVTISLGGEIGHIGGKNSTVSEFRAFMNGLREELSEGISGLSKVSVQTGTHHGGVVLADGSVADVAVDFSVLYDITKVARDEYGMGGAVQHGASTLDDIYFHQFPKAGTLEIHLATGFQNLIMDHEQFPKELLNEMYAWIDREKQSEKEEGWTDEQFHYKLRKKAWGKFKRQCWSIDGKRREAMRKSLEKRFEFLFKELNVLDTRKMVDKYIKPQSINKKIQVY